MVDLTYRTIFGFFHYISKTISDTKNKIDILSYKRCKEMKF